MRKKNKIDPLKYSIPNATKIRSKVCKALEPLQGCELAGDRFAEAKKRILRVIGKPTDYKQEYLDVDASAVESDAIYEVAALKDKRADALHSLIVGRMGEMVDKQLTEDISRYVSGWYPELLEGKPFEPWDRRSPIWTCLYIEEIHRTKQEGRVYIVSARAVSGKAVNMDLSLTMSGYDIQRYIRNAGYTKYDRHQDYEFAGLCFTGLLAPVRGLRGVTMSIKEIKLSSSQLVFNKELRDFRGKNCTGPFTPYKGKHKCAVCPVGRDVCGLSRFKHPHSIRKQCANGHAGYFMKADEPYCLGCMSTGNFKVKRNKL